MSKGCFLSIMGLLVGASLALGQAPEPLPHPMADPVPVPVYAPVPREEGCFGCASEWIGGLLPGSNSVFTFNGEYILWYSANDRSGQSLASNAILGTPAAVALAGLADENVEQQLTSGGRITLGYWQTENNFWMPANQIRTAGYEARFMVVGRNSAQIRRDLDPTIVRPFLNLNARVEDAVVVAAPGLATGGIASHADQSLWGAELNAGRNLYYSYPGTAYSINGLVGLRYLDLTQGIRINRASTFNTNLAAFPAFAALAGNQIQESESFNTRNQFFGPQVGIGATWYAEGLLFEGSAKLAMGNTFEEVSINGLQQRIAPTGAVTVNRGALLALPSNIGRFHRNKFAQVPEFNFKAACPVLDRLVLSVGFSALYWNRIVRPGDQIDRVIDVTQIPSFPGAAGVVPTGLGRPAVPFNQSDLWLLAITFGAEVTW